MMILRALPFSISAFFTLNQLRRTSYLIAFRSPLSKCSLYLIYTAVNRRLRSRQSVCCSHTTISFLKLKTTVWINKTNYSLN